MLLAICHIVDTYVFKQHKSWKCGARDKMINCILVRMIWKIISVHWFYSWRWIRLLRLTKATLILDVWLFMPVSAIPIGQVIWRMVVLSMEEIKSAHVRTIHSNKVSKIGVNMSCDSTLCQWYDTWNNMIYVFHIKLLSQCMHAFKKPNICKYIFSPSSDIVFLGRNWSFLARFWYHD